MKALICPQCGGKITDYKPWDNFALCGYCETKFVIEPEKPKPLIAPPTEPIYQPFENSNSSQNVFAIVIGTVFLVFVGIVFIGILTSKKPTPNYPVYSPPRSTPLISPTFSPLPTPNPNLLEFGGKGTGNGLFQEADSIAVDSKGRIYVADETMRIQQFDEKGNFLKLWQVPTETKFYKRARSIEKIDVDDKDRLFVLVDYGVVLIYENSDSQPSSIVHFAPNPIQDFAFRSDGGRVFLVRGEQSEYFVQVTDAGKTVRRVDGFHTNAADAQMSPPEVGLAAIRIAVDGAGNIFSIYALGDLGSYSLSYNAEDFMIFRFTPEGKFVNKFAQTMNSCGIAVDNQSRIYITDGNSVIVYNNRGEIVSTVFGFNGIDDFALDKQNFVYVLMDDKVFKRPAI